MAPRLANLTSLRGKLMHIVSFGVLLLSAASCLALSGSSADVRLKVEGVRWLDETKVRIDVQVENRGKIPVFLPTYPPEEDETPLTLHSLFVEVQEANEKWTFVGPEGGDVPAPAAFLLAPGETLRTFVVLFEKRSLTWGRGRMRLSAARRAKLSYFAGKEEWERYLIRQKDANAPRAKFTVVVSQSFYIPPPTKEE